LKVLLIDDHPMFREGLRSLLEKSCDYQIVGQANNGADAIDLAGSLKPDIIVMDISMPGLSGLEATRQIKAFYPAIQIIILSRHADNIYVDQALKAGACGYVHKDAAYDELMLAMNAASKGKNYLSPTVLQPIVSRYLQTPSAEGALSLYNTLSDREKEVFRLLAESRGRSVIAEILNISPKTVDRHRSNIMKKLNIHDEHEIKDFSKEIGQTE
jgi:DNA-binding NarL/FixJ family response regulator